MLVPFCSTFPTLNTIRYDRTLIQVLVAFAYTGWMAYSAAVILAPRKLSLERTNPILRSRELSLIFIMLLLLMWAFFLVQHASWTLYVYVVFPVHFWHEVCCTLLEARLLYTKFNARVFLNIILTVLLVGGILQSMV